ncbi:hypothetical protein SCHPADRAFT_932604 [Schizopora paradoxa]|uniref:BTB domain-containing protein n=1 Tax=Schizopora paradoxa TaxID=27342 RepID=A0A0H2R5V2_9AGAM|nr:hypothetical protein SCHPADRAFT_932604 [Schizopora paradoxa]
MACLGACRPRYNIQRCPRFLGKSPRFTVISKRTFSLQLHSDMDGETNKDRGRKRRRRDHDGRQRHEVLWFADGNVVLATDKFLFKVFKGILSMHSSVFKDMFELQDGGESGGEQEQRGGGKTQELYDGVPLVTLVGDKGDDVAHLLLALHDYRFGLDHKTKPTHVRRKPIYIRSSFVAGCVRGWRYALLPVLFFFCSNMSMDTLLKKTESMNPECLHILIKGRDDLISESSQLVSNLPFYLTMDTGFDKCLDKSPCFDKACYGQLSDLISPFFFCTQGREVVETYLNSACKRCGSSAAKSIDEKRQEIWAKVPSYYGYSGWEDAKAKLKEFIDT